MTQNSIFEPDGRAVPYVYEGGEDGPALVLIPGRGMEGGALGSVSHILSEEGFRVLRVGSRTTADGVDVALADWADDVIAVMDHIGLGDAWIGGHGAGSTVARTVVAAHSERADGLLLLGVEDVDIPLAAALPVLIIQGTDDDTTPPANAEKLQASAPDRASIASLSGAGHLFPMTHPVDTAMIIEDYLDWD